MATLIEMSSNLAKAFVQSKNKKYAAKIIIREINSMLYSSTKQPVDYTIKVVMVQVINELIGGRRCFQLPGGEVITVTKKDFIRFSKLEGYILQELWERHELKERELHVDLNQSNVEVKTFTLNFGAPQIPKFNL
jgi:hypothetical protein